MRIALPLAALVLLAGCGGNEAGNSTAAPAQPAAAVAAPAGASWTETVSVTPDGGYRVGNPDAPVKLLEYGSRTCPTCGAFAREATAPLFERYIASGKVSFEFRDFAVHGAPDLAAAVLGRCGGTAPFFPLLEQMYADQAATLDRIQSAAPALQSRLANAAPAQAVTAWAEAAGYLDFVKQRGIPEAKARQCLSDKALLDQVVKLTEGAGERVTGTPTFFINDQRVENAVGWSQVEAALRAAGA